MRFKTPIDRGIFQTIKGRTSSNPQTLVGILGGVDTSDRLILTHTRLSNGLNRLLSAGYIAECKPHCFCDTSSADSPNTFSGLTKVDFAEAVREYDDMRHLEKIRNVFVWQKLVLRWATPGGRWPTSEDEKRTHELAALLDPIMMKSGLGDVNGFELGTGQIDILIFGKATNKDVDRIYKLVAPTFRAFKCPAGSRIIRFFNEGDTEVESDVVPDNSK